tara:strand:- start:583 stop:759 length:177 start_codon:yes stop_codon:yes gene_type:complete
MNPYYDGVVIFEKDLLPKEVANDDNAMFFLKNYGGVTVYLCKITGWWYFGKPPEIYQY